MSKQDDEIDWSLTTWEGSRREQLRRWAQLPLERIIAAQEEMQEISNALAASRPATAGVVQEQHGDRNTRAEDKNEPGNRGGDDG